ncbi:MAG: ABC transporter permease [bacterium]|nr:ABC transporter permease [bacterium]
MNLKKFASFGPAFIVLLCLFLLWQITGQVSGVSSRVLPLPLQIVTALVTNWSDLSPHVLQTFVETVIGLFLAIILGSGIALLLDLSKPIRRALYPLLVSSQTIPLIALAPLLLLWFGFGIFPKVVMVVLYCFFPIAVAMAGGLAQADTELGDLLKSMKATYWQSLRYVRIPGALPSFFAGLKIAATYSVSGAIVGEYVGAYQGLGVYMQTMAHSYATANVFAAIVVTAMLSLVLFSVVSLLEKVFSMYSEAN